jgi:hypothetical protein
LFFSTTTASTTFTPFWPTLPFSKGTTGKKILSPKIAFSVYIQPQVIHPSLSWYKCLIENDSIIIRLKQKQIRWLLNFNCEETFSCFYGSSIYYYAKNELLQYFFLWDLLYWPVLIVILFAFLFRKCERLYLDIIKREIQRGVPQVTIKSIVISWLIGETTVKLGYNELGYK